MYQLKGRVGRSSTQAYAYFMFPEHVTLTEEAAARLTAHRRASRIWAAACASPCAIWRFAGPARLLGAEQSGNMSAVGFDLFAQMLNAGRERDARGRWAPHGELPPALSDITVNIPGHAYLPEEYIPDADARVLWYRKLASRCHGGGSGRPPRGYARQGAPRCREAAANLLARRAWLKAFANEHGVKLISVAAGKLIVEPIDIPAADR